MMQRHSPLALGLRLLLLAAAATTVCCNQKESVRRLLGSDTEGGISSATRQLLGTLRVNGSQGDYWAYEGKVQIGGKAANASGPHKQSVARASGSAVGRNSIKCLSADVECEKPTAQVTTSITPGTASSGPVATADAEATGSKLAATRANAGVAEAAAGRLQDRLAAAVGVARGDAYSVQKDGLPSRSFANVTAGTVFTKDGAQAQGDGVAAALPFGRAGAKDSRVQLWGWAAVFGGKRGGGDK